MIHRLPAYVLIMALMVLSLPVSAAEINDLCSAAAMGNLEKMKAMTDAHPGLVHDADANGFTALHFAVMGDQLKAAEWLIVKGSDVNARTDRGWTPLHWAAKKDHREIALMLLTRKAFVNAQDRNRATPLKIALQNGNREMAALLQAHRGKQ